MADPYAISSYMNPYQQNVLDNQMREARRQSSIMGQEIGLQAAGQGSLGGYREGIMQGERERNLERQLGDIYGAGMQQAFAQGQRGLELDRAYADRAAGLGQSAYQNLIAGDAQRLDAAGRFADLGQNAYRNLLAGDAQRIQAAGVLGDFVDQRQRMEIDRLRNMEEAGRRERDKRQASMTLGYQDFLRQRAYSQEMIDTYSRILQGLPANPGQTQTAYGTGPDALQRLLGAGIASAGLYNAFRGPQG
jgi:hypothetical protein